MFTKKVDDASFALNFVILTKQLNESSQLNNDR